MVVPTSRELWVMVHHHSDKYKAPRTRTWSMLVPFLPPCLQVMGQWWEAQAWGSICFQYGEAVLDYGFANRRLWYPRGDGRCWHQIWTQGLSHPQSQLVYTRHFSSLSPSGLLGKWGVGPDGLFLPTILEGILGIRRGGCAPSGNYKSIVMEIVH